MGEEVINLKSDGWFEIAGRGRVATFKNCHQLPETMKTPAELTNKVVEIDGETYRVRGVEMYVIGIGAPYYNRNNSFGLLVKKVTVLETEVL